MDPRNRIIGVLALLDETKPSELSDLFEAEENYFHFPCEMCTRRRGRWDNCVTEGGHMTTQFSYDNWEYPTDDLTDEDIADIEREEIQDRNGR